MIEQILAFLENILPIDPLRFFALVFLLCLVLDAAIILLNHLKEQQKDARDVYIKRDYVTISNGVVDDGSE